MTVTNHAITAANISLAVQKWWILPIALASHFIVDCLPHYGEKPGGRGKKFFTVQMIDACLLVAMFFLALSNPDNNNLIIWLAMVLAILPDAIWVYRFVHEQHGDINKPVSSFSRLHSKFNWLEHSWGWIIEIGWFIVMFAIFIKLLPL
ncbi:MAG: hypothetical protein WCP03_00905 [Candidatus Saccharibacteria bacterium]